MHPSARAHNLAFTNRIILIEQLSNFLHIAINTLLWQSYFSHLSPLFNPKLAVEIMKLHDEAHKISEDDPKAPDEDYALYADEIARTLADTSSHDS